MVGIKVDISKSRPEIRVMIVSCPVNTTPGIYEKKYLLMFLCSSLKLQNLGVFFEELFLLIYLCLLYTL